MLENSAGEDTGVSGKAERGSDVEENPESTTDEEGR